MGPGTTKTGTVLCNVYTTDNSSFTVGSMSAGASVGVTTATKPPVTFATGTGLDATTLSYFTSDEGHDKANTSTALQFGTKNVYVRSNTDTSGGMASAVGSDATGNGSFAKPYATLATAYTNVLDGGEIRVLSDLTIAAAIDFNAGKTVTIQSYSDETTPKTNSPWSVTLMGNGAEICVITNGTVAFKNITLNGNGNGRVIRIQGTSGSQNAHAILESGATVTGGKTMSTTGFGAGVRVQDGTLTMYDGALISKNNAVNELTGTRSSGGGVTQSKNSTFTMYGGKITDNVASFRGGGVDIQFTTDTFYMYGGEISGNKVVLTSYSATTQDKGMAGVSNGGTMHVKGKVVIENNLLVDLDGKETPSNAFLYTWGETGSGTGYLPTYTPVVLDGALETSSKISISMGYLPTANNPLVIAQGSSQAGSSSYVATSADSGYFSYDKPTDAGIIYNSDDKKIYLDYDAAIIPATALYVKPNGTAAGPGTFAAPYQTIAQAYAAIPNRAATIGSHEIRVLSNLVITATINFNAAKTVTIQSYSDATTPQTASPFAVTTTATLGDAGMFKIASGTVTLKNITFDGGGVLSATGELQTQGKCRIANVDDATAHLIVDSGATLKGGYTGKVTEAAPVTVGGVYISASENGGTLTLNEGGKISGNLNNGGYIAGMIGNNGGGVRVGPSGLFNMSGGEISGNATTVDRGGGGVTVQAGGIFNMTGGTITGNNVPWFNGSGIMVGGVFNMSGGTITGNNAGSSGGGAVFVSVGEFNMSGGSITNNYAGANGGGVLINYSGIFNMSGGTITGNKAAGQGGGVYVILGTVTVSDLPYITGNIINGTTTASNVYLADGQTITITDRLVSGANIGVSCQTMPMASGEVTDVATGAESSDKAYFHSDKPTEAGILFDSGSNNIQLAYDAATPVELYVNKNATAGGTGTKQAPFQTIEAALGAISGKTAAIFEIILLSDVDYTSGAAIWELTGINKNIVIRSDTSATKYTVYNKFYNASSQWHLTKDKNLSLTLKDVTFDWSARTGTVSWGDFFIGNGCTLTMGSGTTFQNSGTNNANRPINIRAGGTVIMMPGSKITGFTAGANPLYLGDNYTGTDNAGGAVYVCPQGTFDMRSGEISGNKASAGAAGVFGENGAVFKMSGAPVVKNNLTGTTAANVYLRTGQTISITGAMTSGADIGVYCQSMPMTAGAKTDVATGATSGEEAYFHSDKPADAGIIYNSDDKKIYLDYNAATIPATVLYINSNGTAAGPGTFDAPYQTIAQAYAAIPNRAATIGSHEIRVLSDLTIAATIDFDAAKTVTIQSYSDATTPKTTSPFVVTTTASLGDSAMLNVTNDTVTLKNITFDGGGSAELDPDDNPTNVGKARIANVNGVNAGLVIDNGATLKGGATSAFGGGVRVSEVSTGTGGKLTLNPGGEISGCINGLAVSAIAAGGGAVWVGQNGSFTMNGGKITGNATNIQQQRNGGGVFINEGTFTMTGGEISDNFAYSSAGGIQIYSGTFNMTGGKITGNTARLDGGGVNIVSGTFNISGNPVITGNVEKDTTSTNNVYLGDGITININGRLATGADIGVYCQTMPTASGEVTDVATGAISGEEVYFHSDKPTEAGILFDSDNSKIQLAYSARQHLSATGTIDSITGKGCITASTSESNKKLVLVGPDGKVTAIFDGSATTFKDLLPGQKYTVYEVTDLTGIIAETTMGTSLTGNKVDVSVPAVNTDANGNITADIISTAPNQKAEITINPSDSDVKYAIVGPDGKIVDVDGEDWKQGNDGSITFSPLDANTKYEVVTIPKGTTPESSPETYYKDKGTEVKTPGTGFKALEQDEITRSDGTPASRDKIVINPTVSTQEYAIVDEDGNVTGWITDGTPGDSDSVVDQITFDDLDPTKTYKVITREKGTEPPSIPDAGVNVLPGLDATTLAETINGDHESITIKPTDTNTWYAVVDPETGKITDDGWKSGPGALTFDNDGDGLDSGKEYIIVTQPKVNSDEPTVSEPICGGTSVITAPEAVTDIARKEDTGANEGSDKITFGTDPDYEYAVVPKNATPMDGDWFSGIVGNGTTAPSNLGYTITTDGTDNTAVVTGLDPDVDYEVIVRVKNSDPNTTVLESTTEVPALIDLTAGVNGDTGKGYITVDSTDPAGKYVLIGPDGKVIETKPGLTDGGEIIFDNLLPGQEYEVVVIDTNTTNPTVGQDAGTLKNKGKKVVIPSINTDANGNITAEIIVTAPNQKAEITINPSDSDVKYAIVGPDGKIVDVDGEDWKQGNDGTITFGPLDANTKYEVVTIPKGTTPESSPETYYKDKGTEVKTPGTGFKALEQDEVTRSDGTPAGRDKIIINPTVSTQEYAIVDEDGNVTGWITDGTPGDSDSAVDQITFDDLDPTMTYKVITREKGSPPSLPSEPIICQAYDLTGEYIAENNTAITINSTETGKTYMVVDPVTGEVKGVAVGADGQPKTVSGLPAGTEYKVVVLDNADYATLPADPTAQKNILKGKYGRKIVTPVASVNQNHIKTTDTTITINPTDLTLSYNIVDPVTGTVVGVWNDSMDKNNDSIGDAITFIGLTPGKVYEVVTAPKEIKPAGSTTTKEDVVNRPGTPAVTKFSDVTGEVVPGTPTTANITVSPVDENTKYAVVDPDTGDIVGVWKQDGKNGDIKDGDLTFTGLTPGKEYTVISVPATVVSPETSDLADESGVKVVAPKASALTSGNLTAGSDSITIKPIDGTLEYAIYDPDTGNLVDLSDVPRYQWKGGADGGTLVFDGLESGKEYVVVTRPKAPSDAQRTYDVASAPVATTGFEDYIGTWTNATNTSISIEPTDGDRYYALIDPNTAAIIASGGTGGSNGWHDGGAKGSTGSVTFTGLPEGTKYEIVSLPKSGGVPADTSVGTDKPGTAVISPVKPIKNDETTVTGNMITINSTDDSCEYAIVDANGNIVTIWKPGTGGTVTFGPLTYDTKYQVVVRKLSAKDETAIYAKATMNAVTTNKASETFGITYSLDGGSGDHNAVANVARYDTVILAVAPTKANHKFIGWYDGYGTYAASSKYTMPGKNVTFTAKWSPVYNVVGSVIYDEDGSPVVGATVELQKGGKTSTNGDGKYFFNNVAAGYYNIVVTYTDPVSKNSTIVTTMVEVSSSLTVEPIRIPSMRTSSTVDVSGTDFNEVLVGGLDEQFVGSTNQTDVNGFGLDAQTRADIEAGKSSIELNLKITQKEKHQIPSEAADISELASQAGTQVALYFDATVKKIITDESANATVTVLNTLPKYVTIVSPIPETICGKAFYLVYSVHNGTTFKLPYGDNTKDAYYTIDADRTTITIYTKQFSTYALAYSNDAQVPEITSQPTGKTVTVGSSVTLSVTAISTDGGTLTYQWYKSDGTPVTGATSAAYTFTPSVAGSTGYYCVITNTNLNATGNPSEMAQTNTVTVTVNNTGSSSGGDSNGDVSSNIIIKKDGTGSGTVTASLANPASGNTVTITVKPDAGYVLGKLTITDANGKEISYADNGDGIYTYTQPNGVVTITATFKLEPKGDNSDNSDDSDDSDVSGLLNNKDHMAFVKGVGNNVFAPDKNMTRAEAAQMFYNLLNDKNVNNTKSFSDVKDDAWYATAVRTLATLGIITGYPDGGFHPDANITRAEFATIAVRIAKVSTGDKRFNDVPATHWAYDYINTAANFGWVTGVGNGNFDPDRNITRAEAVTLLNRMLKRYPDKKYIDSHLDLIHFSDIDKKHWAYYQVMEAANTHDYEKAGNVEGWK